MLPSAGDSTLKQERAREFRFREGISGTGVPMPAQAFVLVAQDGTGDTDDIAEGVKMLEGKAGVVFIKEGTYVVSAAIALATGQRITGAGYGSHIKTTSSSTQAAIFTVTNKKYVQIDNLRLEDLTGSAMKYAIKIIGDMAGSSDYCVVRDCWFEDSTGDCINASGVDFLTVQGCVFITRTGTTQSFCLMLNNCEICLFQDSRAYLNGSTGMTQMLGINGNSVRNWMEGCFANGNGQGNFVVNIMAAPVTGTFLHGCFFEGNAIPGVLDLGTATIQSDLNEL